MKYFTKEAKVKIGNRFTGAGGKVHYKHDGWVNHYSNLGESGVPKLVGGSKLKEGHKLVKDPETKKYVLKKQSALSFKLPRKNYVDFQQLEKVTKEHVLKGKLSEINLVSKQQAKGSAGVPIPQKEFKNFMKQKKKIRDETKIHEADMDILSRIPKYRAYLS